MEALASSTNKTDRGDILKLVLHKYKYLLHITPSYIPAIVDFVKYHKWRTIFYLHDENDRKYCFFLYIYKIL
jgi:hypothetical protein